MDRQEFIKISGGAAIGMGSGLQASASSIKWNVLFLMTDQHNVHYMGCDHQGKENILTPNMDLLAREGMIFDKAYDAYPVCAPTRASLLTGTYPFKHGQVSNSNLFLEAGPKGRTPSLAHVFRNSGYNTAMLGKQHSNMEAIESTPGATFGGKELFHGWNYRACSGGDYERRLKENMASLKKKPTKTELAKADKWIEEHSEFLDKLEAQYEKENPEDLEGTGIRDWEKDVIKKGFKNKSNSIKHPAKFKDGFFHFDVIKYLETASIGRGPARFNIKKGKPFFVFLSFTKPHYPYVVASMHDGTEFYTMYSGRPEDDKNTFYYRGKKRRVLIPRPVTEGLAFEDPSVPGHKPLKDPIWPHDTARLARARYSACISWIDHMFGRIIKKLEKLDDPVNPGRKMSETTIVCYTSDHGDMMTEKNRVLKMVKYEGSARVPFLMRMPGKIKPGQRSRILINHVDMFPTIAGLCGLGGKLPKGLDGRDLSRAVLANDETKGPERIFTVSGIKTRQSIPAEVMTRTKTYKFFMQEESRKLRKDGLPFMVLFDMEKDPFETKNLAYDAKYRDVVVKEAKAIKEFLGKYNIRIQDLTKEQLAKGKGKLAWKLDVDPEKQAKRAKRKLEKAKAKKKK